MADAGLVWLAMVAGAAVGWMACRVFGRDVNVRLRCPVPPSGREFLGMTRITSTQQVMVGPVTAVDRRGNPAPIEALSFSASDDAGLELVPVEPASVLVRARGPVGSFQVLVNADARIGEGVVALTGTLDVEVVAAEAAALVVAAGTPEENPTL